MSALEKSACNVYLFGVFGFFLFYLFMYFYLFLAALGVSCHTWAPERGGSVVCSAPA